jgi:hypothetical protein
VNHPALVKTSDQRSFSFANFSPFTSAEALHASDTNVVPSLNLQPNPRGGTVKKIKSSSSRNFVGATQKNETKEATKSKTNWLASNALLRPSKRRKRGVCRDPTPSDTLSDLDTDLIFHFADDSIEKEQDTYCVFCTGNFSEDHHIEELTRCAKYFRWAHTLYVGMEEGFVCEPCHGISTVLLFLCICNFLNSLTILCAFRVNYSPLQIRNMCTPN